MTEQTYPTERLQRSLPPTTGTFMWQSSAVPLDALNTAIEVYGRGFSFSIKCLLHKNQIQLYRLLHQCSNNFYRIPYLTYRHTFSLDIGEIQGRPTGRGFSIILSRGKKRCFKTLNPWLLQASLLPQKHP